MSKHHPTIEDSIYKLKIDFKYDELKNIMWEWYKHTVNGSFNTSTTIEEREIITSVYERFNELVDNLYEKESKYK